MRLKLLLMGLLCAATEQVVAQDKYPRGFKETRTDVYSLAFSDAIALAVFRQTKGRSFFENPDLRPGYPLAREATLCSANDMSSWMQNPEQCAIARPIDVTECHNADGCAVLDVDPTLLDPPWRMIIVAALEQPCQSLNDPHAPAMRRLRDWQISGLRLSPHESWNTLKCARSEIPVSDIQLDEMTNRLILRF